MVKEMLGHSDVQITMRIYAHIFEADREKVAANVNRAVNEVHQMCMDSISGVIAPARTNVNQAHEQHFSLGLLAEDDLRTSNYEFRHHRRKWYQEMPLTILWIN